MDLSYLSIECPLRGINLTAIIIIIILTLWRCAKAQEVVEIVDFLMLSRIVALWARRVMPVCRTRLLYFNHHFLGYVAHSIDPFLMTFDGNFLFQHLFCFVLLSHQVRI